MKTKMMVLALVVGSSLLVLWALYLGPGVSEAQLPQSNGKTNSPTLPGVEDDPGSEGHTLTRSVGARGTPLTAVPLIKPPSEESIRSERLVDRVGGGSGYGQIRNGDKVIFQGTKDEPLDIYYDSPDGNSILVNTSTSNGLSFIIDLEGTRVMDLPLGPQGMIAGPWRWLGNDRIIGYYGPDKLDESENLFWTRFYVYDLKRKELSDLRIPHELEEKRLEIQVLKTGEFELYREREGKRQWFSVP